MRTKAIVTLRRFPYSRLYIKHFQTKAIAKEASDYLTNILIENCPKDKDAVYTEYLKSDRLMDQCSVDPEIPLVYWDIIKD